MQLFINNWSSALALPATASAAQLSVPEVDAARLVGLGTGDHYLLTLAIRDISGLETAWEIVRVTANTAGVLDVLRGQEGTTALELEAGTLIIARLTQQSMESLRDSGGPALSDAAPAALGSVAPGISEEASRQDHVHPLPTPADIGAATAAQGTAADSAVQPDDLADVAVSGDYADLTNKPTLGTAAATAATDYATAAQGALADGAIQATEKGVALGVATLDAGGHVPAAQLPSYVDDVIEVADFASLPGTGESGKIYVTLDNDKTWRWGGSAYAEISASPGSTDAVPEGVTNLYHTDSRVRAVLLTGLSLATSTAVTAADSLLVAIGKLVARLAQKEQTLSAGPNVTIDRTDPDNPIISASITGGGGGDVVGPASATANEVALFDGITGKLLKGGGLLGTAAATAATDYATAAQGALADGAIQATEKGVALGVATLDAGGHVPAAQLPSYVDDVIEVADFASLPGTGESGKIYVTLDNDKTWRWGGSAYAEISASPGSTDAVPEGATNFYHSDSRVRAVLLTGLSLADSTVVAATDTVLGALGKLAARLALAFDRANHTGSQAISTVTGLDAELDGKEAVLNAGTNITIDRTNPAAPVISASGGGSFTGGTLTSALNEAPSVTLASASTVSIGGAAANSISISGTVTIIAFDVIAAGAVRRLTFQGALTLTHHATAQILPTGANITTAAGDVAEFVSLGSGNWRCVGYLRADGTPLAGGGGGGGLTHFVEAKTTAAPNATVPAVSLAITITETNGDVVLQAKGTGATLAHTPDNATAGGGKRGTRATDWQKLRSNFDQVASGNISVIAGGAYNSATAEGSVVSGGQQNVVTATFATIAGGMGGTVSAPYATISGGNSNTIDSGSDWATICGGISNRVLGTSQCAIVLGGDGNTASGTHSIVLGGMQGTTRGVYGSEARASGRFSATGDAQRERFIKRRSTTSDTPSTLGTNGAAGGSTNQIILPNNSAFSFKGRVVARENATGDCAAWEFSGLIRRGANAAATALVAAVTPTVVAADAGAAAWVVAVTADTTNGGITITVTGEVSHTIRWVADIETVEVAG